MRFLIISGAIGLGFALGTQCAFAASATDEDPAKKLAALRQEAIARSGIEPREDREVRRIIYKVRYSSPENGPKALQEVLNLSRERVLAALADRLLNTEYGHHYVSFVAEHFPEKRLLPFVEARIRVSQGYILNHTLERLHDAPKEFLRALVPVLIEHAINSDYEGRGGPTGMGRSWSALFEAARLLEKATEGKTGIKRADQGQLLGREGPARKAELRAAWRAWWAENRDNWPPKESEAPSRGDGVTVVKPPEDKKTDEEKAPPKGDSAAGATDAPPAKP